MKSVRYCTQCGQLYRGFAEESLCPKCWSKLDTKVQEIETYISEHKRAGNAEVSDACHIESDQLNKLIREHRINEHKGESLLQVACDVCGKTIHSGKLCEDCKKKERRLLQGISQKLEESRNSEGVYTKRIKYEMFTAKKKDNRGR